MIEASSGVQNPAHNLAEVIGVAVLMAAAMTVSLTACGGKDEKASTEQAATETVSEEKSEEEAPAEEEKSAGETGQDPYKQGNDPYKQGNDPYKQGNDPYKQGNDPYKQGNDPYKQGNDPYKQGNDPYKQGNDPYKQPAQEEVKEEETEEKAEETKEEAAEETKEKAAETKEEAAEEVTEEAAEETEEAAEEETEKAEEEAEEATEETEEAEEEAEVAEEAEEEATEEAEEEAEEATEETEEAEEAEEATEETEETEEAEEATEETEETEEAEEATEETEETEEAEEATEETEATEEAEEEAPAPVEEYIPEPGKDAKYTVTVTDDGWVKIENEDGDTLGLSTTSGVKIIEEEGLAFKDLNQNGKLDVYEDWREDSETRTNDLLDQMSGQDMAAILAHGGWGDFTVDPLTEENASYAYLLGGGRGGVTRNLFNGGGAHAKWTNQLQAVAESCYYGIPAMISIDPCNVSNLVESVSLASTMDPELAAEIGAETSKEYRAAGVTALLGPQVDIASPVMSRAGGTYGEDPQLTLDLTTAYVNAMQSTYAEDGTDLGWGDESVICFTKHYGGAGSTEGGRDDHNNAGRYAVFPGDNLEAHLITYFDGVFNLPGETKSSGIMTEYAINVDADGNPYGGEWAGAYNPYLYGLLDEIEYDNLKITDWGVYEFAGVWGAESLEQAERVALSWDEGANLLGGFPGDFNMQSVYDGYDALVKMDGEEKAEEIIRHAAYNFINTMMNLNMFDLPYSDSAYADSIVYSESSLGFGLDTQRKSVVMLKNDGVLSADGPEAEKPTVYVPYVYNTGFSVSWMGGIDPGAGSWSAGMDLDALGKYFNIVTDTLGEPSGEPDYTGAPTYTAEDITRATEEEIAECDYILVGMSGAYRPSYNAMYSGAFWGQAPEVEEDEWYPVSLQYGEYTAETARETSISGKILEDGTKENRSYKGKTAPAVANYGDLEALEYAESVAGDIPVIASVAMERGMVWSEVEPLADAILVNYNKQYPDVIAEIILGKTEPSGLLVFQQPASMEAVEAQVDDVPRDLECYVDAAGNTYDFAFGLNWSGVIDDERVKTYSADPLTKIQSIDYAAYAENYGKAE